MGNPYHKPPGPGGGQFASKGSSGDYLNPMGATQPVSAGRYGQNTARMTPMEHEATKARDGAAVASLRAATDPSHMNHKTASLAHYTAAERYRAAAAEKKCSDPNLCKTEAATHDLKGRFHEQKADDALAAWKAGHLARFRARGP